MWNTVMNINSVLLVLAAVFLVYAIGMGVLFFEWKQLFVALGLFILLWITEVTFTIQAEG